MREGRESREPPLVEGCRGEVVEVVPRHGRIERVIGKVGLDQHLARAGSAPGAARDLDQLREQALGGTEIGAEESAVGVEHAHQREGRIVVALREHLRSEQHVHLAGLHARENRLQRAALRGRVPVHARDARLGKRGCQRLLDALRALPHGSEVRSAAVRAVRGHPLTSATVVAVTFTVSVDATAGAVYKPAGVMLPSLAAQFTPSSLALLTVAKNCCCPPECNASSRETVSRA